MVTWIQWLEDSGRRKSRLVPFPFGEIITLKSVSDLSHDPRSSSLKVFVGRRARRKLTRSDTVGLHRMEPRKKTTVRSLRVVHLTDGSVVVYLDDLICDDKDHVESRDPRDLETKIRNYVTLFLLGLVNGITEVERNRVDRQTVSSMTVPEPTIPTLPQSPRRLVGSDPTSLPRLSSGWWV